MPLFTDDTWDQPGYWESIAEFIENLPSDSCAKWGYSGCPPDSRLFLAFFSLILSLSHLCSRFMNSEMSLKDHNYEMEPWDIRYEIYINELFTYAWISCLLLRGRPYRDQTPFSRGAFRFALASARPLARNSFAARISFGAVVRSCLIWVGTKLVSPVRSCFGGGPSAEYTTWVRSGAVASQGATTKGTDSSRVARAESSITVSCRVRLID